MGVLVSAVVLIALGLTFAVGSGIFGQKGTAERKDGNGKTLVGKSLYAAKDDVCINYLGQLRQSIQIASDPVENTFPETIQETKLGDQFYSCPVGHEPYVYDPKTGKVQCVHPGHEKY